MHFQLLRVQYPKNLGGARRVENKTCTKQLNSVVFLSTLTDRNNIFIFRSSEVCRVCRRWIPLSSVELLKRLGPKGFPQAKLSCLPTSAGKSIPFSECLRNNSHELPAHISMQHWFKPNCHIPDCTHRSIEAANMLNAKTCKRQQALESDSVYFLRIRCHQRCC
jgi:hypothetical protein